MNTISEILILAGAVVALIGSVGLLRLPTTYARIQAGGKASPISFLVIATGCAIELGVVGGLQLAVAALAIAITLPAVSHLLFRAVHRTTDSSHLHADALRSAMTSQDSGRPPTAVERDEP